MPDNPEWNKDCIPLHDICYISLSESASRQAFLDCPLSNLTMLIFLDVIGQEQQLSRPLRRFQILFLI